MTDLQESVKIYSWLFIH